MADRNDPISYAKYVRGLASTERLLRQFLKTETGLGASTAYKRGWTYNFEFKDHEREAVTELMKTGMTFDEAFDYYTSLPDAQRYKGSDREGASEEAADLGGAEAQEREQAASRRAESSEGDR